MPKIYREQIICAGFLLILLLFPPAGFAGKSQEELREALYRALNSKDIKTVQYLLDEGLSLKISPDNKKILRKLFEKNISPGALPTMLRSPLWDAAFHANWKCFKFLVDHGAELDDPDQNQMILNAAATTGRIKIFDYLLSKNVPLKTPIADRNSELLHFPIIRGGPEVVARLLKLNAPIHFRNKTRKTPLHQGVAGWGGNSQDNREVVELLMTAGADPNLRDTDGRTPVFYAVKYGNPVNLFLLQSRGAQIDIQDKNGQTALHLAAELKTDSLAHALLALGANPDIPDNWGRSPRDLAQHKPGKERLFSEFPISQTKRGSTPSANKCRSILPYDTGANSPRFESALHRAVLDHDLVRLKKLLEEKNAVDVANDFGETPLHLASALCDLEALHILLNKGASLELRDHFGQTPLMKAVEWGQEAVVRLLDEKGADLNASAEELGTPIQSAARRGHLSILSYLVDRGVPPDTVDATGFNTLHWAVSNGDLPMTKFLLEKKAAINAKVKGKNDRVVDWVGGGHGSSPLVLAAGRGHLEIVRYLIEKGADISLKEEHGHTPLMGALWHPEVVELLLQHGADPSTTDQFGYSILQISIGAEQFETVWSLIRHGANIRYVNRYKRTILHHAASKNSGPLVDYLLENGLDPNAADENGRTPLHEAIDPAIAEKLLTHGGDPHRRAGKNGTPLESAMAGEHWDVARVFLKILSEKKGDEKRLDIAAAERAGSFPLHVAAERNSVPALNFILKNGAHINLSDHKGDTPLHRAAESSPEAIRFLIEHGADWKIKDHEGLTPVHRAITQWDDKTILEFLKVKGVKDLLDFNMNTLLHLASYQQYMSGEPDPAEAFVGENLQRMAKLSLKLLEMGLDANAINRFGYTPLHLSAESGNPLQAKILIDHGADINARNYQGNTPLLFSTGAGFLRMSRLLVENGADIHAKGQNGNTPLHYAAKWTNTVLVEYLIRHGAFIYARNDEGETPLHPASRNGRVESVRILLKNGADPNFKNNKGQTPFDLARENGFNEIVSIMERVGGSN